MNNSRDRALYETAKAKFPGATPTLSFLREEVVLTNNNGTYNFTFNEQYGIPKPTERKLSIKDAFISNVAWLFLLVEHKDKPGSGVLMTYPNPVDLARGGTNSAEDTEALYNGNLKIQIDQSVIYDAIDTRRFRRVGNTQLNAINDKDEQEYQHGGLMLEPNIILVGSRKNQVTLNLPRFNSAMNIAATAANMEVKAVLVLGGYYIPGGAGLVKE